LFFSYWGDPEKIENIDHIRGMEQSLKESLNRIRIHKVGIPSLLVNFLTSLSMYDISSINVIQVLPLPL